MKRPGCASVFYWYDECAYPSLFGAGIPYPSARMSPEQNELRYKLHVLQVNRFCADVCMTDVCTFHLFG